MILFLKIVITILTVSALSIVAERVSPRMAGILSGYPTGSALSLFFIGLEQGPVFAGSGALYTIAGLTASLTFLFIYYQVSRRIQPRAFSIAAASLGGLTGFLAVSFFLQRLSLPAWAALLAAAAAILGYGTFFRRIDNAAIHQRVRLGLAVVLFRACLAALILLAITGAAHLVPFRWAGLFSAFPIMVFPLVLILHGTYGPGQAHTVIKNFPNGLWSLVLYALVVSMAYPRLGIYWGTLAGFAAATLYLLGFLEIASRLRRSRSSSLNA